MNNKSFSSLILNTELSRNLDSLGYKEMTPIQEKSLPHILAGKDVIAQGKTGSGKTAAFGLGLLTKLNVAHFAIQGLVLCPTRELADQVAKEIRRLARTIDNIKVLTLCGGMPFGPQKGSLEHGVHIVVGTPGRIEDHLRRGSLKLDHLKILVLDEADRMLEMGFQATLDAIIDQTPKKRQTLLLSATFPTEIKSIAERVMINPELVEAASTHNQSTIEQKFYRVDDNDQRLMAVRLLLLEHRPESAVVFCNTKVETQEVALALLQSGFSALALHGDLDQKDRDKTLVQFANKSINVLVATDVAARGLDIDALDAVVNYQLPFDADVYIHRIGRTGRAGSKGFSFSLFNERERHKIGLLEAYLDQKISGSELPSTQILKSEPVQALMVTLQIDGGKKQKVRPGDILGGLTGTDGIEGSQVGKIQIFDNTSFVAVHRAASKQAIKKISQGKLKGRHFRVRQVGY